MSREEILSNFYQSVKYRRQGDGWAYDFDAETLKGSKLIRDLVDAKTKKVIASAGTKMTPRSLKKSIANSRTRSKDAERRSPVFQIAWKRRSRKCSNTNLPPSRPISNEKYWQILQTHETLGRILPP
jgi:hypothetical protein